MSAPPLVSVIIPAYNAAPSLPATLRSVLDQTLKDFEAIVVDDGSSDTTADIVRQIDDPRLRLLVHETNLGLHQARNTAIRAARGDVLAFLDADDLFHPDKLHAHVDLLRKRPTLGCTYNARFDLHYSSEKIRGLWRPPAALSLSDVLLGFPLAPSDIVTVKHWAFEVGLWDEQHSFYGGEYIFLGRLWLGGCKFASVDRALNYRRYHSGRPYHDVAGGCASELAAQQKVFADPRVPEDVRRLRDVAFGNTYLVWSCHALVQNETALGQHLLQAAVRLDPSIIENGGRKLLGQLLQHATADEKQDHESLLASIFAQLPPELAWLSAQHPRAIAQGCLARGTRAVMWGDAADGQRHFARAAALGAEIDQPFVQRLTYELLSYERECGEAAADTVRRALLPFLKQVGGATAGRALNGCCALNRAFTSYRNQRYREVPARVIRAFVNDPRYLLNRGAFSILLRSLARAGRTAAADYRTRAASPAR
ncbi:MAG TPA: glycosyltransferase family A protein [Candidatus Margulisiibacteriota bacterium]|nr:glycosyltransferase family A protein [Candidatus Margulisiibacteriota bacterium]